MDLLTIDNLIGVVLAIISVVYCLYTLYRAHTYFENGVKETLIGWRKNELRLYHVIWFFVDIPAVFIGRIYHVIAKIFSLKLYTFKTDKEEK